MKKKSPTVVFFGNERLATGVSTSAPTLQALVSAGFQVSLVVANYQASVSRNARDLEIEAVANKLDIPIRFPKKTQEIEQELRDLHPDIGVLVAYGKIVPQSVIDIFPHGIINIHPSLLPLHRGPTPIESSILNGDSQTGASIMCLVKAMDAGPVYAQSQLALRGTETKQALVDDLLDLGSTMIVELLPAILDGSVIAKPQDDSLATYDQLINKQDGIIDWQKTAITLEREIRAYQNWPSSRTTLAGKDIAIIKAHVSSVLQKDDDPGSIVVLDKQAGFGVNTGGGVLWIDALKPAGKKIMAAQDFLNGHKELLN